MFQRLIDEALTANPAAGGILLHVEAPDDGVSWCGAAAESGRSTGQEITPGSTALIASITKSYTAAAALRLVEQRRFGLDDAIDTLLAADVTSMLADHGYRPDRITAAHLMANTSGIHDFVATSCYQDRTTAEPDHVWTREEQLELALTDGKPSFEPGADFAYSETNALLLTLILERFTDRPFAAAMRDLLRYDELGLRTTWFPVLEEAPPAATPRVKQLATSYAVDSHTLHPTFDLYGGGGLISTTTDVARFFSALFNGRVFDAPKTLDLMLRHAAPTNGAPCGYRTGLAEIEVAGRPAFGHGGFWGSMAKHLPHLNATVAVSLLERDCWPLNIEIITAVEGELRSR